MILSTEQIKEFNKKSLTDHLNEFETLQNKLIKSEKNIQDIVKKIEDFQVAIPSWALGAGGTRFGRFSYGGRAWRRTRCRRRTPVARSRLSTGRSTWSTC